jgi:hypothetical protein
MTQDERLIQLLTGALSHLMANTEGYRDKIIEEVAQEAIDAGIERLNQVKALSPDVMRLHAV